MVVVFFFPFSRECIKDIKSYSGTVLRISDRFVGAGSRFALPASSRAAHAGLKQPLSLATQKFRDKGRFPTKGHRSRMWQDQSFLPVTLLKSVKLV